MALPNTKVEIAFDSGFTTPAASRTWTDVSAYIEAHHTISITRGRQNAVSQTTPSTLSLVLDNRDGRFTPEKTGGAYYPNIRLGKPIRVTSTYNAVTYVRFTGFVNEWAVTWPDSTDAAAICTVRASSRMARLGRGAELRAIEDEEVLSDDPGFYYPLREPSEATEGADASGNSHAPLRIVGNGTTVTFADSAAAFPGAKFSNAKYLSSGESLTIQSGVTSATFISKFNTSTVPTDNASLVGGPVNSRPTPLIVNGLAGGSLGSGVAGLDSSPTLVTDGDDHVAALVIDAGSTAILYLDGVQVDSGLVSSTSTFTISPGEGLTGTLADVCYFPAALSEARVIAISEAMLTGFEGEAAGDRIERYASYAGVPSSEVSASTGVSTIGHVDTTGQTPIALMQRVEKTENGVLYDAKDGTLTFRQRDARYNVASSLTLSATSQEVEADLDPKTNDQFLINDSTATANGVPAGRAFDQTSIDDAGFYHEDHDTITDDVNDALAGAQWKVGIGKDDDARARYAQVSVDVVNSSTSQAAAVLNAEISTLITLTGLPSSQAPSGSTDLFVEGSTETITDSAHRITFNTSPSYGYTGTTGVWQLGVAGKSELGTTTRLAY